LLNLTGRYVATALFLTEIETWHESGAGSAQVSDFFAGIAWLIPFLPLAGAAVAAIGPQRMRTEAHIPVVAGIALAFLVSLGLLFSASPQQTVTVIRWLSISNFEIPIEFRIDGLTTMMLSMVTFVSSFVAIYAAGYMAGDTGYRRFFALIGLFVFSMTGLVLSNNYVLTYIFWEGVGVCSYLLVGFWHARPAASAAAMKAFLVNRIGDFGFAIAIFWLWSVVPNHDLSYGAVLNADTLAMLPHATIVGIGLLLFWAATAKSAQIPLYVWLPDAMEGPSPVSALIHAATMVTAGVYLIARSMPLLVLSPRVLGLVAAIGCATALLSALIAVTQTDLKRVLAYSTVSQLGYMFMALGAGVGGVAQLAIVAAMFHLFTHAFFKALLFLSAGSVMHAMGDVIDMRRFRGLRHRLPQTCLTFAVGGLALSGIFPLSGFFSKDEILLALRLASHDGGWMYVLIYWVAVFTAFLTAFYTGRAFFMTFWGLEKLPSPDDPEAPPAAPANSRAHGEHAGTDQDHHGGHGDEHSSHVGHESPPIMTYPLFVLAGCTVLIGAVCLLVGPLWGTAEWFAHHLHATYRFESLGHEEHHFDWLTALVGTVAGVAGLALSYFLYAEASPIAGRLSERFRPLYEASLHKFRVDELYGLVVVKPARALAVVCDFLDTYVVDRLVIGVAHLPRLLGRDVLARYQNGLIQFYAAVSALSVTFLLLVFLMMQTMGF
jgi:NADH-quinone oxidoreductase subunit L